MNFFICYNGKYIASRKSMKSAVDFIEAKGYKDDENNLLYIVGSNGICYTPAGEEIDE